MQPRSYSQLRCRADQPIALQRTSICNTNNLSFHAVGSTMDEAMVDEEDVVTQSSEQNAAFIQQLQAISPESILK